MHDVVKKVREDCEFAVLVAATARPPLQHHRHLMTKWCAREDFDWHRFIRLVDRHRVSALVYDGLRAVHGGIPATTLANLKSRALRDRQQGLQLVRTLALICDALESADIPVMSFKGPLLGQLAFSDLSLRQSRDLDVLVNPHHAEAALTILARLGFRLHGLEAGETIRNFGLLSTMVKDCSLTHMDTGLIVELHWRLSQNPHTFPVEFGNSGRSIAVAGKHFKTLSSDDLLIYLSVHGAKHFWFRLKWLSDIYALLSQLAPTDFVRLSGWAAANGVGLAFDHTLLMVDKIYGTRFVGLEPRSERWRFRARAVTGMAQYFLLREAEMHDRSATASMMTVARLGLAQNIRHLVRETADITIDRSFIYKNNAKWWSYPIALFGRPVIWAARKARFVQ